VAEARRKVAEARAAAALRQQERERLRKEQQRLRKVEEAREALREAMALMEETAGAGCVDAVEGAMRAAAKHEAHSESLAALVAEARGLVGGGGAS
jgi:DNA repair ATPase RecN